MQFFFISWAQCYIHAQYLKEDTSINSKKQEDMRETIFSISNCFSYVQITSRGSIRSCPTSGLSTVDRKIHPGNANVGVCELFEQKIKVPKFIHFEKKKMNIFIETIEGGKGRIYILNVSTKILYLIDFISDEFLLLLLLLIFSCSSFT